MQQQPNRLGLGLRAPLPSYGQGPSISALAYQQQAQNQPQKQTTLFVGSISGGITDSTLNALLTACGPIKSFKQFEEPDGALRALALLNNVELPALEDGCANKKLLIKADEKTRAFLDAYASTRPVDPAAAQSAKSAIDSVVVDISRQAAAAGGEKEKYVIPPHLHDLQEADLPETQRGLVISEIAQFRERAAKREREKLRELQQQTMSAITPSGPKMREWGRPKEEPSQQQQQQIAPPREQGMGRGAQGYNKPVDFVREQTTTTKRATPTDEELEADRKEGRRRDEEASFRDRERRYEPRERARINALERAITRQRNIAEAEARDRVEMRSRLDTWDDDDADDFFYTDRARWRAMRVRHLTTEQSADAASLAFEQEEAANLARESEDFLARQMGEMQALMDEQRRAGMLLEDGAPVKLNVSLGALVKKDDGPKEREGVFGAEEDEEETVRKRKVPLVKLDFSAAEATAEEIQQRLESMKTSVPTDKDVLFKAKVRWDGMSDSMIDRKFEPLVKKLMTQYLGDADEAEELIMFVVEHLKDHKGPVKLIEGLEPVLEEEATAVTVAVWRQIIFESMAYSEGLHTERMFVA
ncbi:hypothetical protein C8F01DRAFT_1124907 [Mycena amicta]|nr:hypothetical protein C8F01DRAFT_1124907 [Mycena amicta]